MRRISSLLCLLAAVLASACQLPAQTTPAIPRVKGGANDGDIVGSLRFPNESTLELKDGSVLVARLAHARALLDLFGTTRGALLVYGPSGWTILPPGQAGHALLSGGPGADPYFAAIGAGGGGTWGSITGTLGDQTDLAAAFQAKQDAATAATDAELTAGLATKQDAATAATDAELTAGLATKQDAATAATDAELAAHTGNTSNPHAVTKTQVGLGNVDNTSDLAKPISTATQAALDDKAPLASPALTGNPTAPTQTAGNNSTRIATTAYVDAAVAAGGGGGAALASADEINALEALSAGDARANAAATPNSRYTLTMTGDITLLDDVTANLGKPLLVLDPDGSAHTITLPAIGATNYRRTVQVVGSTGTVSIGALTLSPGQSATITPTASNYIVEGGATQIGGVGGLGSGVATALGVNVGSAGSVVVQGGALGTPSGGSAANLTGLPLSGLAQSGADVDQVPKWSGSAWVPGTVSAGSGSITEASSWPGSPSADTWYFNTTTGRLRYYVTTTDYYESAAYTLTDGTAPTLSSATIPTTGASITLAFNEAVSIGAGGNGGFVPTLTGGAATMTYLEGSGTDTLVYALSRTVVGAEGDGTLAYTQPGSGVEDASGNDLATIASAVITNNSTQSGGVSPIISENFDGAGDPDGAGTVWVATGTVDWDEATIVVSGQSLRLNSSTADALVTISIAATDNLWAKGRINIDHIPSTDAKVFRLYNATTEIGGVEQRATGVLRTYVTGGSNVATTLSSGEDSFIYFWLHFARGAGANATVEVWWSTTSTFPGSSNAQFYAISNNGTSTLQVDNIRLYSDNIGTTNGSTYVENVEIYTSNPGW